MADTTGTDLTNSVATGEFVGRDDGDYAFELDNGARAVVASDEYDGMPDWEPGDEVELLVDEKINGHWAASARKLEKLELWGWLAEVEEDEKVVEGDIIQENKGGLSVDIGVRAFLPRSHVELHQVEDCSKYVGRTEDFTIISFDQDRCNVVVSRKKVLEARREQQREETLEQIEEGATFEGRVRNIQPYGAFVDIGGIDGLLHISNISWERIDHPKEVLEEGDQVEVEVLEWKPDEDRLSLGRKQLLEDPWEAFESEYDEGDILTGEVTSLADFGAFVELAEGLEGLVHVTELSWVDRVDHPGQVVSVGEQVEVKILDIDSAERRVSLSRKKTDPNPWRVLDEETDPGDIVEGTITNITDFGMFVEVREDVEGLVHVSNISWTEQIDDISEHYEVGEEIEAKVLEIEVESQRLGLGIKQLSEDPWSKAERVAEPGEKIDVEITKLTDFGAFAEVVEGVEGLIHISELAERRIDHPREVTRPGDEVEALVLSFDRGEQRISLSLKRDQLEEKASEYIDDDGAATTLGDVISGQLDESDEDDESSD